MSGKVGGGGTHDFARAKIQIGSCKGPVSYKLKQTVFHHDDIPEDKRARRNEIKAWTKSTTLSSERPNWTKSTDPGKPVVERRQMENFERDRGLPYQYNYRSEHIDYLKAVEPIDKPTKFHISTQLESRAFEIREIQDQDRVHKGNFNRTGEMPVHPRLEGEGPWNVSTYFERVDKDKRLEEITEKAKEFTKKRTDKILTKKPYVSPIQSTKILQKTVREMKSRGEFNADMAANRPGHEPVDRRTLVNRYAIEKLNKVTSSRHSGIWEKSRTSGRYMWSDTAAEDFDSKGDVVSTKNMDAFNLEGPNFSTSRYFGATASRINTMTSTATSNFEF